MKKYRQIFFLRLQTTFIYRGAVVIFRLSNLVLLVTFFALWGAADTSGLIGGYTKNDLAAYYLLGLVVNSIVLWHSAFSIRQEIIHGELGVKALIKPVSYYRMKMAEELGWHTVSMIFALATVIPILYIYRNIISLSFDLPVTIYMSFTLLAGSILFFNMSTIMGILAFWFTEIEGLTSFIWMGMFLLGGQSIPLSFFPGIYKQIVNLLPFRYIYSFPLEIYFGKVTGMQLLYGLITQMAWIGVFWCLYKILWNKGLKHYSAYGG